MKLPDIIRVGHRPYRLEFADRPTTPHEGFVWGCCDPSSATITIHDKQDIMCLKDTLLHEIMHAVFYEYGIQPQDDEERTIRVMSTGLTQVFLDNPEIGKFLCYKPRKR